MKETPNIFDYATSELSQDAFFAWLLKWAEDDYAEQDKDLNLCAINLLKTFFSDYKNNFKSKLKFELKDFESVKKIESIDVNTQEKRIDLCITIETDKGEFYLVIEDKTESSEHDNQLKRYRSYFSKDEKERTCFIYLKTGELSDDEKRKAEKEKYNLVELKYLNAQLCNCKSENEIFRNYLSNLKKMYFIRQFIENSENQEFFNEYFDNKYKLGIWKKNCFWFYSKKKLSSVRDKVYLALDVWVSENKLNFVLHIIDNLNGNWVVDCDYFNKINEVSKIISKNKGKNYKDMGYYFEREVSFSDINSFDEILKTEIKDLFFEV